MNPQSQSYGQSQQALYNQLAGIAAQGMKPKEDPKNEFLEKVRKIYMKKMEIKIRLAMGIGGALLFVTGPFWGFQFYRLWRWFNVPNDISGVTGTAVGAALMVLSLFCLVTSFEGSKAKEWARDWILEREVK